MGKIIIKRDNSFMNRALTIDVFFNEKSYPIDSGSETIIETKDDNAFLYAKFLWLKSQKLHLSNLDNSKTEILILPMFSNFQISLILMLLIVSYFLQYLYSYTILNVVFKVFSITFLVLNVYIFTFGYNKYFKFKVVQSLVN